MKRRGVRSLEIIFLELEGIESTDFHDSFVH